MGQNRLAVIDIAKIPALAMLVQPDRLAAVLPPLGSLGDANEILEIQKIGGGVSKSCWRGGLKRAAA